MTTLNDTNFKIECGLVNGVMRWKVLDGSEMVCHSETYNGAVQAAQEIESGNILPVQDTRVSRFTIRESFRFEHYGRVCAERARLNW